MFKDLKLESNTKSSEPQPDIAICFGCSWRGKVEDCIIQEEGDYESGYYNVHVCPNCDEEDGCISEYDMSEERSEEWNAWYKNKENQK
jgi:hypothetical protein